MAYRIFGYMRDGKNITLRLSDRLAIRFIPGLWWFDALHNRENKYYAIMFPGLGISIDYKPIWES